MSTCGIYWIVHKLLLGLMHMLAILRIMNFLNLLLFVVKQQLTILVGVSIPQAFLLEIPIVSELPRTAEPSDSKSTDV